MARKRKKKRPGKDLENLIETIERGLGSAGNASVQSPAFLPDKITGDPREHDVLVTLKSAHHETSISIECRDRSRKVTVNDVEGFWKKCQDTGINQGIIVSPKGFSKGALTKAAHLGLRTLRLSEIGGFSWLQTPGIRTRVRKALKVHWTFFPTENPTPAMTSFGVFLPSGEEVPSDHLTQVANQAFQSLSQERTPLGQGTIKIKFPPEGLVLKETGSERTFAVDYAVLTVDYEVAEGFAPFSLYSYSNEPSGELITHAAIAKMDLEHVKGSVVINYREEHGGTVSFVP